MRTIQWIVLAYIVLLGGRMICLQLVQHDRLSQRGQNQWIEHRELAAERGDLFDRNGRSLALSVATWDIGFAPSRYRDQPREVMTRDAERLARIADVSTDVVREKLSRQGDGFFYVGRRVVLHRDSLSVLTSIRGVSKDQQQDRIYPFGGIAASLIGMYRDGGVHDDVMSGIEQGYDQWLRGTSGEAIVHHTPNRGPGDAYEAVTPAIDGLDLELTLDCRLQSIAEDCLKDALVETSARGGVVLIVDPGTGDVLAAADSPVVRERTDITDHNSFWNNSNFTLAYEPGSIFKLFTAASLLTRGAIDTVMTIDCDDTQFGGYSVHNDMNHKYGELAFMKAFARSSNVFFARAVLNLAEDEFLDDIHLFGFDRMHGIRYPSSTKGILAERRDWERRRMPTIAYGQAIATTPLHLAMAAAAVANGGELMAPRLVRRILTKTGRVVESFDPVVRHRVIDEDLARLLRHAMALAVTEGTGVKAAVNWTSVGGKTGTAEKVVEGDATYTPGAYMSSFLGFVPADEPRLVILTMLDQPDYSHHYASESAAPLFRSVVEGIGRSTEWLSGVTHPVEAVVAAETMFHELPDVRHLILDTAREELERLGFLPVDDGRDGLVVAQIPMAGTRLALGEPVTLTVDPRGTAIPVAERRCPDLTGLSSREVRRRLADLGVSAECMGIGYVVGQTPAAGDRLAGRSVQVRMEASWR